MEEEGTAGGAGRGLGGARRPGARWGWCGAAPETASILGALPAPGPPTPAPRHVWRFLPGPYKALPLCPRPIQGASFPARLADGPRAAVGGSQRPGDPLPRRGRPAALGTRSLASSRPGLAEVNGTGGLGSLHVGNVPSSVPRRAEVPTSATGFIFCLPVHPHF